MSEDIGKDAIEYRLLGPLDVRRGGRSLGIGARQGALLALLLIEANRVVSTDRIIDELWGNDAGPDRQNALWVQISRLRSVLEPGREKRSDGSVLLTRPPGYVLVVDPERVDSHRFDALAREGRALLDADPGAASLVLSEALALWRGPRTPGVHLRTVRGSRDRTARGTATGCGWRSNRRRSPHGAAP